MVRKAYLCFVFLPPLIRNAFPLPKWSAKNYFKDEICLNQIMTERREVSLVKAYEVDKRRFSRRDPEKGIFFREIK